MCKKYINVFVDERPIKVQLGCTIMQTCSQAGVEIPKFCYHDKLLIAGNCRICLVEVTGSKKLVASCAMHVADRMSIYTNTIRVRVARQNVLEFLLANHPLDCPICDQGGECDLQDITAVFGADRGRFYEFEKRAVLNKDLGPLIRTSMNRCIHCTRCVRFLAFSSGMAVLGTLGRGSSTEIGLYINQFIHDELSGNITDLCPVGALTSKPYSFKARPWELTSIETIDILDVVNANVLFDVTANKISRVLPYANDGINECWITNKARYAYDGLFVQRLNSCLLKINFSFLGKNFSQATKRINSFFLKLTWSEAFSAFFEKLTSAQVASFAAYIGGSADIETVLATKTFLTLTGATLVSVDSSFSRITSDFNFMYLFNTSLTALSKLPTLCLLLGLNPRFEAPLLNLRLIRLVVDYNVPIYKIGSTAHYSAFATKHISNNISTFLSICEFKHSFCKNFYIPKISFLPFILVGQSALMQRSAQALSSALLNFSKRLQNIRQLGALNLTNTPLLLPFGFVFPYSGNLHALDVGFNGSILNFASVTLLNSANLVKYSIGELLAYSVGYDSDAIHLKFNLLTTPLWIVYQGIHGTGLSKFANLVFPVTSHVEKTAIFKNLMGLAQQTAIVVTYHLNARSDVDVFRGLAQFFSETFFARFANFEYRFGITFSWRLLLANEFFLNSKFLFDSARSTFRLMDRVGAIPHYHYLLLGGYFLRSIWCINQKLSLLKIVNLVGINLNSRGVITPLNSLLLNYYGDSSSTIILSSKTMSLCANLYAKKNLSFSSVLL